MHEKRSTSCRVFPSMQTFHLLVTQYSYTMAILFVRRAIFPRQRMCDVSDERTECSKEQLSLVLLRLGLDGN